MRKSEMFMSAFILAVIIAGCFGPYMISIGLTATAGLLYAARRSAGPRLR